MDASEWPEVPTLERGKKPLYVDQNLDAEDQAELRKKGWVPTDVRLMPTESESEKRTQLNAQMQGWMSGSMQPNKMKLEAWELAAKALRMLTQKETAAVAKAVASEDEVAELRSLNSARVGIDLSALESKLRKARKR